MYIRPENMQRHFEYIFSRNLARFLSVPLSLPPLHVLSLVFKSYWTGHGEFFFRGCRVILSSVFLSYASPKV